MFKIATVLTVAMLCSAPAFADDMMKSSTDTKPAPAAMQDCSKMTDDGMKSDCIAKNDKMKAAHMKKDSMKTDSMGSDSMHSDSMMNNTTK